MYMGTLIKKIYRAAISVLSVEYVRYVRMYRRLMPYGQYSGQMQYYVLTCTYRDGWDE